jgi:hypothetical protein
MVTHLYTAQNLTAMAQGLPLFAHSPHTMRNDGARTLIST